VWKSDSAYDTFESTVLMGPRGGYSPCLANLKSSILERAPQNQERQFLSVDCTFKLCEEECVPFLLSCGSSRVQGSYPKRSSYGGPTEFVQPTRFVQAFQFSRKLKNLESNSEANACCNPVKCHLKCVLNLIQGLHTFHFFSARRFAPFLPACASRTGLAEKVMRRPWSAGCACTPAEKGVCMRMRARACVCVPVRACVCVCARLYTCSCVRACALGCVRARVRACLRAFVFAPMQVYAYTCIYARAARACAYVRVEFGICARMGVCV
jgi:hypothetical protein